MRRVARTVEEFWFGGAWPRQRHTTLTPDWNHLEAFPRGHYACAIIALAMEFMAEEILWNSQH